MKKTVEIFVGIDVSKAWLDVAVHEQKEVFRVSNGEEEILSVGEEIEKTQTDAHCVGAKRWV